ncbi:hypothetical protein [Adhaeretor mobilis]|uniref:Uncharacterized protein n=1 Tax=Adhaeretor mobilis TaxID=1930276 RepID=A0A517MZ05_9BACT|nr:hypothetical protein [Adhaeretor mobilis]QDT00121.1 hypothetical protein HG15A2_34560 [Adhaeretor mobilis]
MRRSDLHTGSAQLRDAFDELLQLWNEVSEDWNDSVSRRFCEQELEPLAPLVKLSLEAMNRTTQIVSDMHRDCEDQLK